MKVFATRQSFKKAGMIVFCLQSNIQDVLDEFALSLLRSDGSRRVVSGPQRPLATSAAMSQRRVEH